jgi:hypothetical protein
MKELEPRLLLRTWLNRCGRPVKNAGPQDAPNYTWLAEPYAQGLEAMPGSIRVSGSDTRMLSVRMAFGILTSAPLDNELKRSARQATRKIIVDEIRAFARSQQRTAEEDRAAELLHQPAIEDDQVSELLARFDSDESACNESAAASRNALAARLDSYSATGPTPAASVATP